MKRREELELTIENLAFGGKGIARVDGFVVFVPHVLPGDRVRVRIRKVKKAYAEAVALAVLEPSPMRIPALCSHVGSCGGCRWQELPHEQQLVFKKQQVIDLVQRVGGIEDVVIHDPIPAPDAFRYRNKMEFSFSERGWLTPEELANPAILKEFALGLHSAGHFDRVLNIRECWLMSETMNEVLVFSREWFRESGLPVYHVRKHTGLLRHLVLRESRAFGDIMVNVVTSRDASGELQAYADALTGQFSAVRSVVNTVNERAAQVATGDVRSVLAGEPVIRDRIGSFTFTISPDAFFQTNTVQAETLYRVAADFAEADGKHVWDLYCGTGTIAIFLSDRARSVLGFELVENAVNDAIANAKGNGVTNCAFVTGDIRTVIADHMTDRPDVIVCDPPRAGMHPDVVAAIRQLAPERVVYVSCDPATMARDLAMLTEDYRVVEIQPVDMFPHTYHIESVARLDRR